MQNRQVSSEHLGSQKGQWNINLNDRMDTQNTAQPAKRKPRPLQRMTQGLTKAFQTIGEGLESQFESPMERHIPD